MDDKERQSIFTKAKDWVLHAGNHIREVIDEPLYIDIKSNPNDLVTHMDKNTEQYFAEKIRDEYPTHKILSEEGFGDELDSLDGIIWIIDPIDGTMNFVHQKRNFAISIGIYHDGVGEIGLIYDVMNDVLYSAQKGNGAYKNDKKLSKLEQKPLEESILIINSIWACENPIIECGRVQDLIKKVRGTRSYGSAALEFAFIAEGIVDGYITMRLAPWDIAGGIILVDEVGGISTTANGEKIDLLNQNTVLSSNHSIHDQIKKNYVQLK